MAFQPVPGYTGTETCTIDKKMIATVGIAKYVEACRSQPFANIKLTNFDRELLLQACNAGCHYINFRKSGLMYPQATQEDVEKVTKKLGKPVQEGVNELFSTVNTAKTVVAGVSRTARTWADYERISRENAAVLNFMTHAFEQAYQLNLSALNNPFTTLVIRVVTEYFRLLPQEILYALAAAGKIKIDKMDVQAIIRAVQMNITAWDVNELDAAELSAVASALADQPSLLDKMRERMMNKITGKIQDKITEHIATSIGIMIAKKIAAKLERTMIYQELMKVPQLPRGTKNLLQLLKEVVVFQGHLEEASNASRDLQAKVPAVWSDLRAAHGLDMIYYATQSFLGEYVDRIDTARSDPSLFARLVLSFLEPPTQLMSLFLPFVKYR